jgi:hypothetical protein
MSEFASFCHFGEHVRPRNQHYIGDVAARDNRSEDRNPSTVAEEELMLPALTSAGHPIPDERHDPRSTAHDSERLIFGVLQRAMDSTDDPDTRKEIALMHRHLAGPSD